METIVYIEPWSKSLLNNKLFNGSDNARKDHLLPYSYLKEYCEDRNIRIETADKIPEVASDSQKILYYSFGSMDRLNYLSNRNDIKYCSFYLFEPPIKVLKRNKDLYHQIPLISNLFKRIYTTSPISEINQIYNKDYRVKTELFQYPQSHSELLEKYWQGDRKDHIVMINSYRYSRLKRNQFYSKRLKLMKFLARKNFIDLYGNDWNKLGGNFLTNLLESVLWSLKWVNLRRLKDFFITLPIRGFLKNVPTSLDKYETMSQYKYAICFESMGIQGFISEKIFECFFCGTVPIYLGDPKVTDRIPDNTFIDPRKFKDNDHLYHYVKNLSEEDYLEYRNNIKQFLLSDNYYPFSKEYFAEHFYNIILEDIQI